MKRAFTLIELLIVVAIIAILAAIAVPNFLEAQTRSKVARVKADMRTLATAIESYHVDNNRPPIAGQWASIHNTFNARLQGLTTPIAYVTSLPVDVFFKEGNVFPITPGEQPTYEYEDFSTAIPGLQYPGLPSYNLFQNRRAYTAYFGNQGEVNWSMNSAGPDRQNDFQDPTLSKPVQLIDALLQGTLRTYDPTNGTVSKGDIARTNAQQRN